jgi:hypothetical protein
MAKQNTQPHGRSRLRIFYVEGDLAPGELQQITQAFANATRPAQIIARPAPVQQLGNMDDQPESQEDLEVMNAAEFEAATASTPKVAKVRKFRSPKVVDDLNMDAAGKPFSEFVADYGSPSETLPRYLLCSYWLDAFAKVPEATADHIYTCYLSVPWTFEVPDPGQPFRSLKANGAGDTKKGAFVINHIGKARVEKMKAKTGGNG